MAFRWRANDAPHKGVFGSSPLKKRFFLKFDRAFCVYYAFSVCSLTYDNMQALKEQLKADEGEHNSIYLENYNRPCFGYGYIIRPKDPEFNLPIGTPVSAERINEALEGRLYMTIRQLQKWVLNCPNGVNNCDQWPVVATSVLTNMMYDLGGRKMKNKFKALRYVLFCFVVLCPYQQLWSWRDGQFTLPYFFFWQA